MAVLVEAISVIVRKDAIERAYPSGWRDFVEYVPNETFCADDDLARVGFMNPRDVKRFIERICTHGLIHMSGGKFVDIAVVDQQRGPTQPCDWLEFESLPFGDDGGHVSACWLFEGPRMGAGIRVKSLKFELATPAGWDFETSMSTKFTFVPNEGVDVRLEFLRTEDGVDVFWDTVTEKEVFVPTKPEK